MIKKNLTDILKCINCGEGDLRLSSGGNKLVCTSCNQKYSIRQEVPLILQHTELRDPVASAIHKKQGTVFNYIDHYQKDAEVYDYFGERDSVSRHGDRRTRECIVSYIPEKTGRILDVGCGSAWVARSFCPKGYEVVSTDISLKNTSEALSLYPFANHFAVVADVYSLPFKKNTFDYIIASEIIEHVVYPDFFVKTLFEVLKPGGILIITTPYKEKLQYSLCIHCNKLTPFNAHIHSFDEKILTSLYTGNDVKFCNYQTFGNKILIHLHTHVVLKYLNFKIWKILDRFFNMCYRAPSRIIVIWGKS